MVRKYSVSLHGHRTSFSLEEDFFTALKDIAARRGKSLASLIAEVDDGRPDSYNLSSALRVYVLREVVTRNEQAS
ncbi:ribbon-helix-helix domain-containing protein [Rhizobium sp. TH2]|uniref:ribbon-helix-helix domain-containing protein n=1 Tax=Rhizobium sp. TH2 TaxID=2775403 RepID=UPI00215777A2|nr:ribbon-helix-helix domain-containing protein [Rhizobium sp. TH2]UVC06732.1 ribbon-helix-helix domain-containing protein [Rhizobium sp. TH2]